MVVKVFIWIFRNLKVNTFLNVIKLGPSRYIIFISELIRHNIFSNKNVYEHYPSKFVTVAGYKLMLPPRIQGIAEELQFFHSHEPLATKLYSKLLKAGDIVIDVGTNFGYYLAIEARFIGQNGAIYGFEPDPELYRCALNNAKSLHSNIYIFNAAISNQNGLKMFYCSSISNYGSLLYSKTLLPVKCIQVRTIKLDDFCKSKSIIPNVIRMDIEGGELEALFGAKTLLRNYKPKLFIEVHPPLIGKKKLLSLLTLLSKMKYKELIFIDRVFDQPWISPYHREKAIRFFTIDELLSKAWKGSLPITFSIITNE